MAQVFSAILGILAAIPALLNLVEQFVAYYVNSRIESMKVENYAAIKKAIEQKDQRDLEKALGNQNAGEPSGVPGVVVVDHVVGVPDKS